MSLNQIVLLGTVDRHPDGLPKRGNTPNGRTVTRLKLLVEKPARQEGQAPRQDAFLIEAGGRMADEAAEFRPGDLVAVEGRLVTYSSTNPRGEVVRGVYVDASSVSLVGQGTGGRVAAGNSLPTLEPLGQAPAASVAESAGSHPSDDNGDDFDNYPF